MNQYNDTCIYYTLKHVNNFLSNLYTLSTNFDKIKESAEKHAIVKQHMSQVSLKPSVSAEEGNIIRRAHSSMEMQQKSTDINADMAGSKSKTEKIGDSAQHHHFKKVESENLAQHHHSKKVESENINAVQQYSNQAILDNSANLEKSQDSDSVQNKESTFAFTPTSYYTLYTLHNVIQNSEYIKWFADGLALKTLGKEPYNSLIKSESLKSADYMLSHYIGPTADVTSGVLLSYVARTPYCLASIVNEHIDKPLKYFNKLDKENKYDTGLLGAFVSIVLGNSEHVNKYNYYYGLGNQALSYIFFMGLNYYTAGFAGTVFSSFIHLSQFAVSLIPESSSYYQYAKYAMPLINNIANVGELFFEYKMLKSITSPIKSFLLRTNVFVGALKLGKGVIDTIKTFFGQESSSYLYNNVPNFPTEMADIAVLSGLSLFGIVNQGALNDPMRKASLRDFPKIFTAIIKFGQDKRVTKNGVVYKYDVGDIISALLKSVIGIANIKFDKELLKYSSINIRTSDIIKFVSEFASQVFTLISEAKQRNEKYQDDGLMDGTINYIRFLSSFEWYDSSLFADALIMAVVKTGITKIINEMVFKKGFKLSNKLNDLWIDIERSAVKILGGDTNLWENNRMSPKLTQEITDAIKSGMVEPAKLFAQVILDPDIISAIVKDASDERWGLSEDVVNKILNTGGVSDRGIMEKIRIAFESKSAYGDLRHIGQAVALFVTSALVKLISETITTYLFATPIRMINSIFNDVMYPKISSPIHSSKQYSDQPDNNIITKADQQYNDITTKADQQYNNTMENNTNIHSELGHGNITVEHTDL